jgi:hypothetical protein
MQIKRVTASIHLHRKAEEGKMEREDVEQNKPSKASGKFMFVQ